MGAGWSPSWAGALCCGFPASTSPVVEGRGTEVGCNHPGLGQCYLVKREIGALPWLHTQEAHQPLLAVEVWLPCGSHFRPCPSPSCSRPSIQCPQPSAGLPAPARQASAAPAGLQALAGLPLQWCRPAQSLPQLQHGRGWAGGWEHAAKLGVGREGGLRGAASQKLGLTRSSFSSNIQHSHSPK